MNGYRTPKRQIELSAERRLELVARIAERSLATDENMGDVGESLDAILYAATAGRRGQSWGIVESVAIRS